MTEIIQNGRLSIPLYHGTPTLFVDSIANHGLGGMNPVKEWSLLELAKEVLLLSEGEILPRSSESLYGDLYALSNPAYEMKTQQSNFRLHEAIPVEKLRFWLINTQSGARRAFRE